MSDVRALILLSLKAEVVAFQEVLRECPERMFAQQPKWGHSVAWHALHIMDWTRCMIQPGLLGVNPALTYGYLGFETEEWAKAVGGPTLAHEQDSPEMIRNSLQLVFGEALDALEDAPQERFTDQASWTTLKKPKPVLAGLLYHLSHTAYHRGQIRQLINEMDSFSLREKSPGFISFAERIRQRREAGIQPIRLSDGPSIVQMIREGRGHTDDEE